MFTQIYNRSNSYFSKHPMLNALAHASAGFGLALVLQHYLKGNAFLSPYIGWALIIISALIHIRSFMK